MRRRSHGPGRTRRPLSTHYPGSELASEADPPWDGSADRPCHRGDRRQRRHTRRRRKDLPTVSVDYRPRAASERLRRGAPDACCGRRPEAQEGDSCYLAKEQSWRTGSSVSSLLVWTNTSSSRCTTRGEMPAVPLIGGRLHRPGGHACSGETVVGGDAGFVPAFTEMRALPPNVIRANADLRRSRHGANPRACSGCGCSRYGASPKSGPEAPAIPTNGDKFAANCEHLAIAAHRRKPRNYQGFGLSGCSDAHD